MNDLEQYFNQSGNRTISKWRHYFDVYDRHLNRFRNKEIVVMEIGVWQGGSLDMWKEYFGPKARLFGVDIDPKCKELENGNATILIGSQADRKFLRQLKKDIPRFDILIDDGGHTMEQQIVTFEELFAHVKEDGVYICEDLHTSYWLRYGGGHKRRGTFIEYSKNFIDYINAWHSEQKALSVNEFCRSVDSLHYYDSMLVIEKRSRQRPVTAISGLRVYEELPPDNSRVKRKGIRKRMSGFADKVLQRLRMPEPRQWARRRFGDRSR